ncbi:MAG TPA: hypothetical protein VHC22_30075 [Pirellulales bacterium]|nr:hypothetical protein [Pirellulales bacterium]
MTAKIALLSCVCWALALGALPARAADRPTKPVVVLSFAGIDELQRDVEYLGVLAGKPDLAAGFEELLSLLTEGRGWEGVDPARPWGATLSVSADGSRFPALAFVPVSDFDKLLITLKVLVGKADDVGGGIYEIKYAASKYYIRKKGDWACVAREKKALREMPNDPLDQLRGLDKQYDLALGVNAQNIPPASRGAVMSMFEQVLEAGLTRRPVGGDNAQQKLPGENINRLLKDLGDLDRLTLGLNIDRSQHQTYLNLDITALPGTAVHKSLMAGTQKMPASRVAGIVATDAVFSLHANAALTDADKQQVAAWLKNLRDESAVEIDSLEGVDDGKKSKVGELAGKLLDLVGKTSDRGRINAGLVVTGPVGAAEQAITIVAGGLVIDAPEWEDTVKQFLALADKEAEPRLDVDTYKAHHFHTLSIPIPETETSPVLRQLMGDPVRLTLACGDETFFAAVGKEGIDTIKRVIDQSETTPAEEATPLMASLGLSPLLHLAASQNRNQTAAMLAKQLRGGDDHVLFTMEPLDNGVRYRLKAEADINRLLGFILSRAGRIGTARSP